jgi:hypothetical protein
VIKLFMLQFGSESAKYVASFKQANAGDTGHSYHSGEISQPDSHPRQTFAIVVAG